MDEVVRSVIGLHVYVDVHWDGAAPIGHVDLKVCVR